MYIPIGVYVLDAAEIPSHTAVAAIPWLPGFGERADKRIVAETTA